ncbi:lytic transglycosylase domain-containing protein [Plastoroseomonas arctica]|uniref:Lytic transglycosylase domain-containing protein n=1 Tax=Plastoroseomonas arctica TaxID=1509237 RepID=A0AAF1K463_9PROT|nr:lytic transglycosylase domain-containing protein [Plastoroseomonas arctica]MBR0655535.1 lytic transglycosylase domain-containing protein [Plastoroseomonas arctica]
MLPSAKACARSGRFWPMAAVAMLALLGACAQQAGPTTTRSASRPVGYDPPGPPGDPWGPYIREASRRFDVPERWVREVMRQESGGRSTATSSAGAMGLMQVMPGTYAELRRRHGLGDDPYHPYDSIMAGTAYIREMYDLYGSPAFLAAYNAGPRRLEDYLWASRGLPNETRNYVARIGPRIEGASPTRRAPPEVYAAAEIPTNIPPGPRRMDSATMLALREQRQQRDSAPSVMVAQQQLPPGPVIRMETVDTQPESSYQVASLAPLPPPGAVIRMDPIPDGSTYDAPRASPALAPSYAAPAPAPSYAPPPSVSYAEPLPLPPAAITPRGSRGSAFAANAAPLPGPAPRGSRNQAFAALVPPPPPPHAAPATGRSLGLIGAAQASSLPAAPRGAGARQNWGIQVGAFASENVARSAASQVRDQVAQLGSRTDVQPVSQGSTRLYRARVTGISREAAEQACARSRSRDCTVLSP